MKNNIFAASIPTQSVPSFSKLLTDYLRFRATTKGAFYISEWLDTLSEQVLSELDERIEQVIGGGEVDKFALLDLVMLCETALTGEKRGITMPKKFKGVIKIILILQAIGATVVIAKHGFIELHGPIGLSSKDGFKYSLTDRGRQIGVELGVITQ